MMAYEVFSTTADIGIKISGNNNQDLCENGIKGLNSLIFGKEMPDNQAIDSGRHSFIYKGDSFENVLVNLFSEVIFLIYFKNKIIFDIEFREIGEDYLNANLLTTGADILPQIEIKSVTYHNLKIKKNNGKKSVKIIFDI